LYLRDAKACISQVQPLNFSSGYLHGVKLFRF